VKKNITLDTGTELPQNLNLTNEFKNFYKLMEDTDINMFLTGKAGSGKSTLLEYFRQNTSKNHVILAPTGIAAIKARGQTIHSFFKFPPRVIQDFDVKILRDQKLIKNLDTILIDESSMIRADMLDAIDLSLKKNRKNIKPFGGVQIILIGDLFQLPPVVSSDAKNSMEQLYPDGAYFFNSNIFNDGSIKIYELTKIFRQREENFINLLNKIRISKVSQNDLDLINKRVVDFEENVPEGVIILSPKNIKVDQINTYNLNKLDSDMYEYIAEIKGTFKDSIVDEHLKLKVGAQIMLVKNDLNTPRRWVNGTLGIIEKLEKDKIFAKINGKTHEVKKEAWHRYDYRFSGGSITPSIVATFIQYPIKLAWAATIHKCQGQTFQKVAIDLDTGAFSHGQTYVALSRATSLEGVYLKREIYNSDLIFDKKVYDYLGTKIETKYIKEIEEKDWIRKKQEKNKKDHLEKIKQRRAQRQATYHEKVAAIKEKHTKAYDPWTEDQDQKLLKLYKKNVPEIALSKIFKRQLGAIRSRIMKLLNK
tara:strand:- start:120 stop:1721 length:1602 start_codon:yes stop_codon:yes gene_type:complete